MQPVEATNMTRVRWITCKEAAALVGISVRQFRAEWIPENGLARVNFRNTNGKAGSGRRPEVDLEDLEAVLSARTHKRVV